MSNGQNRDSDGIMLEKLGNAVTDMEVKFRNCTLQERAELRPLLEEMLGDFTQYRLKLLKEGIITTEEQIAEMGAIKQEIDSAANKQALLAAIARTIAFVATKI